ncbi:hypothetical protein A2U01_0017479 [Trifolium medium]|uniref:Uncharacterized protein n=1 Tax=Trifolium medium TaxID=97028 RepID=A0A392N9Z2_9FABA|nr:hypothetical protein [Trifolium medium]
MYEVAFKDIDFRLPSSNFQMSVFHHLDLAPSQLHLNYLAFIRAFEIVAEYLEIAPTIRLLFHAFHLQPWDGRAVFDKELDDYGEVVLGEDGKPVMKEYDHFPFVWWKKHYTNPPSEYVYPQSTLSEDELSDYDRLVE